MSENGITTVKGRGFAVWSIIFGVACCLGSFLIFPAVFGITGVVFSLISSARGLKRDINAAGMVISVVGLILCIIFAIIYILILKSLPPFISAVRDIIM